MRVRARIACIALALLLSLPLTGCDRNTEPTEPSPPPVVTTNKAGDVFLSSGFKIRTEIKPKGSVSADPLIFEVYVDGDGDGAGLVGYQDNVYDVYLVADQIYVTVSSDVVVHITDVSAHMIPTDLSIIGNDLNSSGFSLLDGRVVSYIGGNSTVDMVSKYEQSVSTFEPVAISQSNNMTTNDLIKYFFETTSTVYVETPDPTPEELERQSYYVNSAYGVTIRDKLYSIGDLCSPYTYFEGATPQGMNQKEERNEDQRVVFVYVSYLSSDGSSMFMTTDGYVQAISTTSDFVFLEKIKRGMSKNDLEALLGLNLKRGEVESFVPIRPGLTAEKGKKGYILKLDDLTIELELGKDSTLAAITVTNYLDFRS